VSLLSVFLLFYRCLNILLATIYNEIKMCVIAVVGPLMVLELCDMTLKEWLNQEKSLSVPMLDDILLFALNIASGVAFLHSQHV